MNQRPSDNRRHGITTAFLIVLATTVAYLPALRAGYIWDDDAYVTENRTLDDLGGLRRIWFEIGATDQYYPLVFTTFWIERHLWGLSPLGYHLVNVLLHATAAILAWRVLRRLALPGALLAAFLFALHPVHVESVAWITERKNVLSGVFYLAALSAYLRFAGVPERTRPRDWRWYGIAVALFCGALLSKTVTATLPAAALLLIWWKRGGLKRRDVLTTLPMFALGAAAALITVWLEKHHVGTKYIDWNLSFADRFLVVGRAFWFYLGKLLRPADLTFIYPRWRIPGAPNWHYIAPVSAALLLVIVWTLRKQIGKGLFVALGFFVITLSPALGFIDVYPMRFSFVADHFQYLASLGPLALLAAVVVHSPIPKPAGRAMGDAILLILAVLTWRQCGIYRDAETLWLDTIVKNPDAWIAHGNLAAELALRGRADEAIHHYREGLRLKEDAPQIHFSLAVLLHAQGRVDDAVSHYERALQLQPRHAEAHNNLGVCLAGQRRAAEAIAHYETALEIKPDYADAHGNLANLIVQQGRVDEAIAHYRKAIALTPDNPLFHFNFATALKKAGQTQAAMSHYTEAARLFEAMLHLDPDHAQARAGLAHSRQALQELANP